MQERICSSTELDCFADQDIETENCLERCSGIIVDVEKVSRSLNEEGLADVISDYEKFKYPYYDNLTYPIQMKGLVK